MPKRKFTSTTTSTSVQPYARRRLSRPRIPRGINWKGVPKMVYPFIQTITLSPIQSNISAVESNYAAQLDLLTQYTTFTALFDAYRIMRVDFKFIPRMNTQEANPGNYLHTNLLYTATDYDDNSVIGITGIQQFQDVKVTQGMEQQNRTIYPRVADTIYNTAVSSAYSEGKHGVWIDCGNPSVPHYGLRTILGSTSAADYMVIDVVLKMYIEFKNVR